MSNIPAPAAGGYVYLYFDESKGPLFNIIVALPFMLLMFVFFAA